MRALTGLPSRYTRKSVSLIPEKRRPCGAEDTLLIQGPAHPSCVHSRGRKTGHRSQTGACREGSEAAHSTRTLWEGWVRIRAENRAPSPATLCQARPHPVSPAHLPRPVSMVSFSGPFPRRSSSLGPYLIVDRPVPGFGCEFIVVGFEAIVTLQESGKEKLVKADGEG